MKELLNDLLATIIFFIIFSILGNIFIATGVGMAVGVAQIAWAKYRGRRIEPLQWMGVGLVVVFGGLTLFTHDSRFIMVKPSIIHFAIGFIMLRRGWLIRYLPPVAMQNLPASMVIGWGYAWAGLMFVLGITNIIVAMTCSPVVWAWFLSFGAIGAKLVFFGIQYLIFRMTVVWRLRQPQPAAN